MNINKKYDIIYADPPWKYSNNTGRGCAGRHYDTMSMEELKELPIADISNKNAVLLLWVTSPFLQDGLRLMDAWGFSFKNVFFTWIKTTKDNRPKMGIGNYTRQASEFCLLGVKGRIRVSDWKRSNSVKQVIMARPREHSRKPDEAKEKINEFFVPTLTKIELFARETVEGWDVWGNETNKFT